MCKHWEVDIAVVVACDARDCSDGRGCRGGGDLKVMVLVVAERATQKVVIAIVARPFAVVVQVAVGSIAFLIESIVSMGHKWSWRR